MAYLNFVFFNIILHRKVIVKENLNILFQILILIFLNILLV